jgi:hypothetical protein
VNAVVTRRAILRLFVVLWLLLWVTTGSAVQNPDQITVFFPAFEGPGKLGLNVSTVLSLQLAQTTRRYPWPDNPDHHEFGEAIIRWSAEPLEKYSVSEITEVAQKKNLLAQIVIVGKARRYSKDIVVELEVLLPRYRSPQPAGGTITDGEKNDFRQKNFETWLIDIGGERIQVDLPKRYFSISTIVLKPEIVDRYGAASGLPIRESIEGGRVLGETGDQIRFIEFNKRLPGAPAKIRSGGVVGYVSLPELSDEASEFADMVGGILQVFRGDWQWAINSFTNVLENPKTRTPLKVDALLYRGMARFKKGGNGLSDIASAVELAPYDATAIRYLVMAQLANGEDKKTIAEILEQKSLLFGGNDHWLKQVRRFLEVH